MSSTTIIAIIVGLIVLSVVVSAISYSREQAMSKRNKEIKKHRHYADELMSYVDTLSACDESFDLLLLLQGEAVTALEKANTLAKNDSSLQQLLDSQKTLHKKFQQSERSREVKGYFNSDAELSRAQIQLNQLLKLLELFHNQQKISKVKLDQFTAKIRMLKLDIDVNSHLHQARIYGERNDIVMYQVHIKQAISALKKSAIEFESKNARIKELSNILNEAKRTNKVIADEPPQSQEQA